MVKVKGKMEQIQRNSGTEVQQDNESEHPAGKHFIKISFQMSKNTE